MITTITIVDLIVTIVTLYIAWLLWLCNKKVKWKSEKLSLPTFNGAWMAPCRALIFVLICLSFMVLSWHITLRSLFGKWPSLMSDYLVCRLCSTPRRRSLTQLWNFFWPGEKSIHFRFKIWNCVIAWYEQGTPWHNGVFGKSEGRGKVEPEGDLIRNAFLTRRNELIVAVI